MSFVFLFPGSHFYCMELGNDTEISEFLLLGFSQEPELQPLIFGLFLSMYLITVFGNLLIMLAVSSDAHLHTPMYFFLSNLSFVTVQKDLNDLDNHDGVVTHVEPDILEYVVKCALGSITTNKASRSDGIPAELFKILKDDAVKCCTQYASKFEKLISGPQYWKRSVFSLFKKFKFIYFN